MEFNPDLLDKRADRVSAAGLKAAKEASTITDTLGSVLKPAPREQESAALERSLLQSHGQIHRDLLPASPNLLMLHSTIGGLMRSCAAFLSEIAEWNESVSRDMRSVAADIREKDGRHSKTMNGKLP